jgi:hypothetical protein
MAELSRLQELCLQRYIADYGNMSLEDILAEAQRMNVICGDLGVFDPAYARFQREQHTLYQYAELVGLRDDSPESLYCRPVEAIVALHSTDAEGYVCQVPLYVTHQAVETYVKRHYARTHRLTTEQEYRLQVVVG